MNRSKITLADIAETAGVSPATVSRVLNGDPRVATDRVERVNRAIKELGYSPNRAARTLVTGKTGLVAAVIDSNLNVFSDPFWGQITTGISQALQEANFSALLMVRPLDVDDPSVVASLAPGQVDGAIFFQLHNDDTVNLLQDMGLPLVVVGRPEASSKLVYVDSDNLGGAVQATEHLIARGCRTVATVAGNQQLSSGRLRLEGYRRALVDADVAFDESLVAYGDWTDESGAAAMGTLLDSRPDIDGVFVANDLMALGVMTVLEQRGLKVPDQIAVVGFDNMFAGRLGRQQLTTVEQDVQGLGAKAASMVIQMIDGGKPSSVVLPTSLIVRETA
ncbi:MAG: LacI family transcriptional regulator [Actinomycetales bacterium]|nr:LacI family transcriptional regulator [Actinomycetales bacterium]